MKIIKIFILLAITVFLTNCNKENKSKSQESNIDKSISRIEVYDFHSMRRCITCNAIEANTKYTLDTYFAKELKENKITFQILNVDDKKNSEIVDKFQVSGTSLILNVIKKGKETQLNLTNFAFMKGKDKAVFSDELKAKLVKELKLL